MAHADIVDGRIVVQTHWNEKELVKRIPGVRWDATKRLWTLPISWAAGVQLSGVFRDQITYGEALRAWAVEERRKRIEPALRLRELTDDATL